MDNCWNPALSERKNVQIPYRTVKNREEKPTLLTNYSQNVISATHEKDFYSRNVCRIYYKCGSTPLKQLLIGTNGTSKSLVSIAEQQKITFQVSQKNLLLGFTAPVDMNLIKRFKDALGQVHYKYQQTWKGIPIEDAVFTFHTMNNSLVAVSGKIILEVSLIPSVSEIPQRSQAAAILDAMKTANGVLYAWQDQEMENRLKKQYRNENATFKPQAKLVWYCPSEELIPSNLHLAYKVNVYSLRPLKNADYFIDAHNGQLLGVDDKIHYSDAVGNAETAYSGTQSIHSDFTGSQYRLRDYTKGNGIITLHGESGKRGTDYYSNSPNWSFNNSDQAALDAHYGVSASWLFYKTVFDRNSYDDKGTTIYSYVNDPTYLDNAFWDGTAMNFNKRSNGNPGGVTAIDVTGHELTHGVTQETSGLKYKKESGGINESLSDIMGKAIQFYAKTDDINWVMSNDMDWAIRNMANPKEFKQPDTYKGTYWKSNADVHTLSGVGNYMFYLLCEGGTGVNDRGFNYKVNAIGIEKARAIIYRSNLLYLTPNSVYLDWRNACEQAAIDLYGKKKEYRQVKNAWDAVGVDSLSNEFCYAPVAVQTTAVYPKKADLIWKNYAPGAVSYNIVWKESNKNKWDTIYNITDTTYTFTNLKPATYYRTKVASVCAGNVVSDYAPKSDYTFVTQTKGNYCFPQWGGGNFYYITSVTLNGKTNNSGRDGSYADYIKVKFPLQKSQTYSLQIQQGVAFSPTNITISVYIDYNRDKDLSGPGELVARISAPSGETINIPFTVPSDAATGSTRMRIVLEETWFAYNSPCMLGGNGEVEDYTVDISGAAFASTSGTENVQIGNGESLRVVPNPVNDHAMLNYELMRNGKTEIIVADYLGKSVMRIDEGFRQKGAYQTKLATTKFPAGVYIISVVQNQKIVSREKMIVVH